MGTGRGQGGAKPDGAPGQDGKKDRKGAPDAEGVDFTQIDDIKRSNSSSASGVTISSVYETAQDYIDALNANGAWVAYDAATNTATIKDLASFANAVKTASKGIAALDQLDSGQG